MSLLAKNFPWVYKAAQIDSMLKKYPSIKTQLFSNYLSLNKDVPMAHGFPFMTKLFAMWWAFTDSSMNYLVSPAAPQRTHLETEDADSVDLACLQNFKLLTMRSFSKFLFSFHLHHLILPSLQLLWMIFVETFWSSYCFKYQHCSGSMISVPYPPHCIYSPWVCVCVCVCARARVCVCVYERERKSSPHISFIRSRAAQSHSFEIFSVYDLRTLKV